MAIYQTKQSQMRKMRQRINKLKHRPFFVLRFSVNKNVFCQAPFWIPEWMSGSEWDVRSNTKINGPKSNKT